MVFNEIIAYDFAKSSETSIYSIIGENKPFTIIISILPVVCKECIFAILYPTNYNAGA